MITDKPPQVHVFLWGTCPVCQRERRVTPGTRLMAPHNVWTENPWPTGEMLPCPGTGESSVSRKEIIT